VSTFKRGSKQYDVIAQVSPSGRSTPEIIQEIYVRGSGGLVQLAKLDRNTARRQAIAAAYDAAFADLPVQVPAVPDGRTHVYHQYTLDVGPARDAILAAIREGGVGADIYYPIPVHRQPYIRERGLTPTSRHRSSGGADDRLADVPRPVRRGPCDGHRRVRRP
jgi:hypothetical protein